MSPARATLVLLVALLGAGRAEARALVEGDVLVADDFRGVILVDPVTGAQTDLDAVGAYSQPVGIAVTPTGRVLVVDPTVPVSGFAGRLYRLDPATGNVVQIVLDAPMPDAWDVELAADGTAWVVGDGLWRVEIAGNTGQVVEEVAGSAFGRGFGLSLKEDEDGVGLVRIAAGQDGLYTYLPESGALEAVAGTPTPEGNRTFGVVEGVPPLFLFTQFQSDGSDCATPDSGIYAFVIFGFGPLSTGGELLCPRAVARRADGVLYSAGQDDFFGTGRVVELVFDSVGDVWQQRLLTSGDRLGTPHDVEVVGVVPEPGALPAAVAAALALVLVRFRRR